MDSSLITELQFFGISIAYGILLIAIYDIFVILRNTIKHKWIATSIEDIVYWTGAALIIFDLLYKYNYGQIRAYAFVGIGLGMVVYHYSISPYLVGGFTWILLKIKGVVLKILGYIFAPFIFIFKSAIKGLKNVSRTIKIAIRH